jgi:lipopolysaccharide transport system permease protein
VRVSSWLACWQARGAIASHFVIDHDRTVHQVRAQPPGGQDDPHPLAQVLIFAFVLSAVMSAKLLGINNRFAYAITRWPAPRLVAVCRDRQPLLTLFIDNGNILKKLAF